MTAVGDSRRIPVIMFHTIDKPDTGWLWHDLTCPVPLFDAKIASLSRRGYHATTLDEVVAGQTRRAAPIDRRVVLTFDDGYLDNWVHAFPLLKRAGWRGIVYVNPEFVDPGTEPRPNLEDVWAGRVREQDLQSRGFLNWAEIEIMDRSGVLEVGNHSLSHTWYPTSGEIVDFHRPGLATPWLSWNERPDRKPFYLVEDQSSFVPWGTPIHRNGRSLGIRRYLPDPEIAPACAAHVAASGGEAFFGREGWLDELRQVAARADRGRGRLESDSEMKARFSHEIGESARILAERVGHPVAHFCWPGGAYCDESWEAALDSGCASLTVRKSDLARWRTDDPRLIRRISEYRHFSFAGKAFHTTDPGLLPLACDVELGRAGAVQLLRARKVLDALRRS